MTLPKDIIKNILSDYIEYDQLQELIKYIPYLKLNPKRIKIEVNESRSYHQKVIYIDHNIQRKIHSTIDGNKILDVSDKDGVLDGKMFKWYENGNLISEENYKNGKEVGLQLFWYENGQLESKMNYENGEFEGKQYAWYENGNPDFIENFKNGKLDGTQLNWRENGIFNYSVKYNNGEIIRDSVEYKLIDL